MIPIRTFKDLMNYPQNPRQHWYYVILVNAIEPSMAAKAVLRSLDMFDFDSGNRCDYFLPGYDCCGKVNYERIADSLPLRGDTNAFLERYGWMPFNGRNFASFYLEVEKQMHGAWRYSGRCEMLIFNIDQATERIDPYDFYIYDLDDIVKNNRNITEFIRATIQISQDRLDKVEAKRKLDEYYADLVMPGPDRQNDEYIHAGENAFRRSGYLDRKYAFISYSSKDYQFVNAVRFLLEKNGISCWMAPQDIPRGTSYPYVIEQAIRHASLFILMLSPNAAKSVWVIKELCRAIDLFGNKNTDKICVAWRNGPFPLAGTQFALPLEDIQIKVDLQGNPNNWPRICGQEDVRHGEETDYSEEDISHHIPRGNDLFARELLELEGKKAKTYWYYQASLGYFADYTLQEMEYIYNDLDDEEKKIFDDLYRVGCQVKADKRMRYPRDFSDAGFYYRTWAGQYEIIQLLGKCQDIINKWVRKRR